jgi:hypothetical protein
LFFPNTIFGISFKKKNIYKNLKKDLPTMEEKLTDGLQNQVNNNLDDNDNSIVDDEKGIKILLQWEPYDIEETPLDPEEDGFELGMLEDHGLITHDLKVTPQGWKEILEILEEWKKNNVQN